MQFLFKKLVREFRTVMCLNKMKINDGNNMCLGTLVCTQKVPNNKEVIIQERMKSGAILCDLNI